MYQGVSDRSCEWLRLWPRQMNLMGGSTSSVALDA